MGKKDKKPTKASSSLPLIWGQNLEEIQKYYVIKTHMYQIKIKLVTEESYNNFKGNLFVI